MFARTASTSRDDETDKQERWQELVELAPDGILIHDGQRIVMVNAAALQLAGAKDRSQVLGLPIDRFLNPPYLKAFKDKIADVHSLRDRNVAVRDTFRRLDGSEVQVEVRAAAYIDRDRPAVHLVVHDMTARLAAEQALRQVDSRLQQAQKMEAVGMLAGGMAHEINNMMAVVLGCGEFLKNDERMPSECQPDLAAIMQAAERAASIAKNMLAFSRKAVYIPERLNLDDVVRIAGPAIRRLLGEQRTLAIETSGVANVWADADQLQQIIAHLALNAREAMPHSGKLVISTAVRDVLPGQSVANGAMLPPARYATISMQDNGVGIDANTQARMFEPFFTTKTVGQGSGLGLAASLGMTTQNNGFIGVASTVGNGATFTIYLPVLTEVRGDAIEPVAPALPLQNDDGASAVVLVVDDEIAIRSLISRSLDRGGFDVRVASDGEDALENIAAHGVPDLVLTDVLMPKMNGASLAGVLNEKWPALPIMFMSGYSADELLRQGAVPSTGEVLQKPFSPASIVARVAEMIAQNSANKRQHQ